METRISPQQGRGASMTTALLVVTTIIMAIHDEGFLIQCNAGPVRYDGCRRIEMRVVNRAQDEHIRLYDNRDCSHCCAEKQYLFFKWDKKPHDSTRKTCSCTQEVTQLRTYLRSYYKSPLLAEPIGPTTRSRSRNSKKRRAN